MSCIYLQRLSSPNYYATLAWSICAPSLLVSLIAVDVISAVTRHARVEFGSVTLLISGWVRFAGTARSLVQSRFICPHTGIGQVLPAFFHRPPGLLTSYPGVFGSRSRYSK